MLGFIFHNNITFDLLCDVVIFTERITVCFKKYLLFYIIVEKGSVSKSVQIQYGVSKKLEVDNGFRNMTYST